MFEELGDSLRYMATHYNWGHMESVGLRLKVRPVLVVVQSLNTHFQQFFCRDQKKTMSLVSLLKSTATREEKIQKIHSMIGSSMSVCMVVDIAEELIQPSWADYLFCRTVASSSPAEVSSFSTPLFNSVSDVSESLSCMTSLTSPSLSENTISGSQTSFISITFRSQPSFLHYSSVLLEDDPQSVETSLNYFHLKSEKETVPSPKDFQFTLRRLPPLPTSPKKPRPPFRP